MEEELILNESENIKTSDYIFKNKEIKESFAVEDILSEEIKMKLLSYKGGLDVSSKTT